MQEIPRARNTTCTVQHARSSFALPQRQSLNTTGVMTHQHVFKCMGEERKIYSRYSNSTLEKVYS